MRRTQTGVHSMELVAGLAVLIPLVLYGIDVAVMYMGSSINNQACTAACRAAASGPPSCLSSNQQVWPRARAKQALQTAQTTRGLIVLHKTLRCSENVVSVPKPPFGGPVVGTVSIKTRVDVYPPFKLPFIASDNGFYATQTYPFTYVMAATYNTTGSLGSGTGTNGNGGGGSGNGTGGGGGGGVGGDAGDFGGGINSSDL